ERGGGGAGGAAALRGTRLSAAGGRRRPRRLSAALRRAPGHPAGGAAADVDAGDEARGEGPAAARALARRPNPRPRGARSARSAVREPGHRPRTAMTQAPAQCDRRWPTGVNHRLPDRTCEKSRGAVPGVAYFVGFLPVIPRWTNRARLGLSSACLTPQEVKPF